MIIRNISKNTIYIEDINSHIPYTEKKIKIPAETIRKSRDLRALLLSPLVEILEHDENEQIEKSVMYTKKQQKLTEEIEPETEELTKISDKICVKIHGIFYEAGGYAKVNRYLSKNLSEAGILVKIDPKKGQNHLNSEELKDIAILENTKIDKKHIVIDSIIPSFSEVSSASYKILYTTVEAYSLPKQFVECCQQYNEIWTTSPFAKEILEKYITNTPIFIVPTGVDSEIYNENVEPVVFNPQPKKFVFMSVFGWSYRKGYDLLFKSYFKEFSDEDDVSLLLFTRYMQGTKNANINKINEDIDKIKREFPDKNLPHFKIISKIIPEKTMPEIYSACNAFVLPSRGECTCMPPCEASLCGLPVIMTNVSGQRIYLNHDNSYLIEPDNIAVLPPNTCHVHYWDGQEFPVLKSQKCIDDFAGLMREVYENYEEAKIKNRNLQKLLLSKFTWKHAANVAVKRLIEISKGI